ncbi:MAG: glycosyltransferase [Lentisphaeria bacterium]|nr:glycosyltransferase [Lentisphaeria bacterium]
MKILHVNYHDIRGGAALAAFRLCRAQRERGLDARMLTVEKLSDAPWVGTVPAGAALRMKILQRGEHWLHRLCGDRRNFMPRSLNLFPCGTLKAIEALRPDIVHLHWVNGQMLSLGEIPRIPFPVVWTLHDTWAYCGSEHHHLAGDTRYAAGYGGFSPEAFVWKRKLKLWREFSPVIAGPSAWISREAKDSRLFRNCRVEHIFNGIDLKTFRPRPREEARRFWGIPDEARVIVIGAVSLRDPNKGGPLLTETLAAFPDATVLAVGGNVPAGLHGKIVAAGRIDDPEILALAYSAGDVFLSAALYDNLPNMVIEALACGTCAVAVDTGGVGEIVGPSDGIVTPSKSGSLIEALHVILEKRRHFFPSAARFDIAATAEKYEALYRSLV